MPAREHVVGMVLFAMYLCINLSALLLAAQSQQQPRRYLNSTAVTLSEVLKLITSIIAIYGTSKSATAALNVIVRTLFGMPDQMLRVAMPALLYTIQNNIIYIALQHLDAVSFQITYQLKIVAALIASRVLLKKRASAARWLSVLLLTAGVIMVQLSLNESAAEAAPSAGDDAETDASNGAAAAAAATAAAAAAAAATAAGEEIEPAAEAADDAAASSTAGGGASSSGGGGGGSSGGGEPKKNRLLGLVGVLVACLCSGLAGAVMELLLKGSSLPLAQRNLQVAFVSLLLASFHMFTNDSQALRAGGFFQGYTRNVWAMVTLDSAGGILVSMLLKYTTAMLKNFAAPIGIILNCLLAKYVFKSGSFQPNRKFLTGTALVLLALGLYGSSA